MKDGPLVLAAFTRTGAGLALRLGKALAGRVFASERCLADGAEPMGGALGDWTAHWFPRAGAMVFVGACGIAVRAIAPHVRAKTEDPAVVAVDEQGRFAIPVLSGHIGGANDLARRIAALTKGQAAVTTATDVNGLVAVDEWAVKHNCAIENPKAIKDVSGALLDGHFVGVAVTDQLQPSPWPATLWLRPKVLALGVGCKRGVSPEAMEAAAQDFLEGAGASPLSLMAVASIDLKAGEPALIALAKRHGAPFVRFSPKDVAGVPGQFSPSQKALEVTGVDNVCERAAVLAASSSRPGGDGAVLLRSKARYPGMTFALAKKRTE